MDHCCILESGRVAQVSSQTGGRDSPGALCDEERAVASHLSQPAGYCFNRLWVPRLYLGIRKRCEQPPLGQLPLAAH